jgi:hypothetical protein
MTIKLDDKSIKWDKSILEIDSTRFFLFIKILCILNPVDKRILLNQ